MTKTKSQKARAAQAKGQPKGGHGKKKRWEFNLIKTGDNSVSYMSGNKARSMMPTRAPTKNRNAAEQPGLGRLTQVKSGQIIEQDEFVGLINGNTSFGSVAYSIQPGLAAVFPWGSKVANLYERYRILSCEFYYKPTVSPYAVGGQQGKVVLSIDYDAAEGPPTTIQEAESMDPHADALPYESLSLWADPARATPEGGKFVREGPVAGTDIKTYDAGNLYVTVVGTANDGQIGELRVRYSFSLMNPRLSAISVPPCRCVTTATIADGTAQVPLSPLTGWVLGDNPLGIAVVGEIFTLPAGHFIMSVHTQMQCNAIAGGALLNFAQWVIACELNGVVVHTVIRKPNAANVATGYGCAVDSCTIVLAFSLDLPGTLTFPNTTTAAGGVGVGAIQTVGGTQLSLHMI